MKHPRTWYVVADGGRARILQKHDTRDGRDGRDGFDTQYEFVSADIHSHTHELGAERPGRTHESANAAHHAVEPREDLHRTAKRKFVDELARVLNQANAQEAFDRLILVAPARALGELNHALDAATQQKVAARLQKDITHVPNADLSEHFAGLSGA
jgi:protein required for attachment to host cells